MVGAALGMAEDHPGRAGIAQHGGRDVAGMRAAGGGVAVLPADRDRRAGQRVGDRAQHGGRRADQQIAGQPRGAVGDGPRQRHAPRPASRSSSSCRRSADACRLPSRGETAPVLPQGGWQTKGRGPMVRRSSRGIPHARIVPPGLNTWPARLLFMFLVALFVAWGVGGDILRLITGGMSRQLGRHRRRPQHRNAGAAGRLPAPARPGAAHVRRPHRAHARDPARRRRAGARSG